jgi:type 1 glutamine amidotransferase
MFEAAKRFGGVLGCLVAVAACDAPVGPARGGAGSGGGPTGSAGSGASAAAGTGAPAAGSGGAPTATPDGAAGAAPTPGSGGAGAPVAAADAAVDRGGSAGAAPALDAATVPEGGTGRSLPRNVLIFTRSTNTYVHESKLPAAAAIKAALAPLGVTAELSEDIGVFTAASLARFGALVLVDTTGKPVGDPGTAELGAMETFVKAGGGLVGVHAATATTYGVTLPYIPLLGGRFVDHPGGIRTTTCFPMGAHPAVAQLPASFSMLDEIFTFDTLSADNQVVVQCLATDGKTRIPIAWHHLAGAGRVFNTAFGHPIELWTPDGLLLKQHVIPGILWTLGL